MNTVISATRPPAQASVEHRPQNSVVKAAQEFESQLLSMLLAPLEQSFSAVPGGSSPPGSDNYGFLGMQALAAGLSSSGGLGIAALLIRQLSRTEVAGSQAPFAPGNR